MLGGSQICRTDHTSHINGKEHGAAAEKGNWHHSGLTQEHCKEEIDYSKPAMMVARMGRAVFTSVQKSVTATVISESWNQSHLGRIE